MCVFVIVRTLRWGVTQCKKIPLLGIAHPVMGSSFQVMEYSGRRLSLEAAFEKKTDVTPQTRGSVDYLSTRGIQVEVELPDATLENRAESPLYGELYTNTVPAYTCPKQFNIIPK